MVVCVDLLWVVCLLFDACVFIIVLNSSLIVFIYSFLLFYQLPVSFIYCNNDFCVQFEFRPQIVYSGYIILNHGSFTHVLCSSATDNLFSSFHVVLRIFTHII